MLDQDGNPANGYQALDYSANPMNMVNGGGIGSRYTKMDLSAWDQATICGSCHPGGGFMETDRNGKRFSMMNPMVDGMTPYTMYVFERFDPATGVSAGHTPEPAPWSYPIYMGSTPLIVPPGAMGPGSGGWGQAMTMTLPDGSPMPIQANQVMMPNVKEFDCLMCHGAGFSNLMSSVMSYSGAFNAAPSFGAGFMSMFTEAYDFTRGLLSRGPAIPGMGEMVVYNASNLKGNPASENCQACHLPSNLKDIPDMFRDFLSSAPMIYTGSFKKSFTGLGFPAYDLNAPFGMTWNWTAGPYATSPVAFFDMQGVPHTTPIAFDLMIPGGWPAAMGVSEFNKATAALYGGYVLDPFQPGGFLGGGNPAGSGPIYYQATLGAGPFQDQHKLKKSIVPFPRAEWFKRGDVWINGYDVHKFLECSGCHMDTATTKIDNSVPAGAALANTVNGKSLCDPGRGFDSASGIETGNSVGNKGAGLNASINSQSTVKSCENCHVNKKNDQGVAINTFGAPDPTGSHTVMGLYDTTTKGVNAVKLVGGVETTFKGSHMDILDCTVCHLYRKQMVVRSLDSTSGHRFPNMTGIKPELGMMGMFQDPFGAATPMINPMFPRNDNEAEWTPVFTWQKWGNILKNEETAANPWRRKIYAINYINAVIWNNEDSLIDANGDGVPGRAPSIHAHAGDAEPTFNYDNWISRDMKEGMNFGPSGFAPVPVGFGGGAFQSAYMPDGSFTGAWNYVGLYGGNVVFSTPEEIDGYLAMRNAMSGNKWAGTRLTFSGAPFKMTHGIRPVAQMDVLGKNCADCHAPGTGFFDGKFNMLGAAVKATAGANFMQSPSELMQVVGTAHTIETGAEIARKDGGLVEVKFEELGDWTPATKTFTPNPAGHFKRVAELDRGEALYPQEMVYTGADGTTYANRAAWLKHLTDIAAPPVAAVGTISPSVFTAATPTDPAFNTVASGTVITFTGTDQANPSLTYQWSFSDGVTVPAGIAATRTFTKYINLTATLTVKNTVTGKNSVQTRIVKVTFPGVTTVGINTQVGKKVSLALSTMPAHTSVRVEWGDGSVNNYTTATATFNTPVKTYYATGVKTAKIRIFSGTKQVDEKTFNVTLP